MQNGVFGRDSGSVSHIVRICLNQAATNSLFQSIRNASIVCPLNTWEYDEVLKFPETDIPIVGYAWTAGQTIRPNGQVLEGNPAMVLDYVPLTRHNYKTYTRDLIQRAERYIAAEK